LKYLLGKAAVQVDQAQAEVAAIMEKAALALVAALAATQAQRVGRAEVAEVAEPL
jgi:hypothetical protein